VTAAPGAGKTTRVPPALVDDGPVLLLQPRRVAARSIARRIAGERAWTVGREVGWQVRFERRFSSETKLLVATEGVLTARLQEDPLLSAFRTVVLDEFHERSIHADLGLALTRQAWLARQDLRIVVMSATLEAARVSAFLSGCPIVNVPGRLFPVDVQYRPSVTVEDAVVEAFGREGVPDLPPLLEASPARRSPAERGAVLVFLPGALEIRSAAERLQPRIGRRMRIFELHGGLDAEAQDAALAPSTQPRIVLATNIAETTITVPDVRVVVDAGLQKLARYDAARGVDSLETERISQDAADQRAGRAGRLGPGRAIRLWDSRDRLRPHREPEVARIDLAAVAMDVLAWGGDPRTLEWFEAPPPNALDAALDLLARLGAVDPGGGVTPLGNELRRFPLHPRLGRLLLDAHGAPVAARACALLSERHFVPAASGATTCDLLAAVERDVPPHVRQVARGLRETAVRVLGDRAREQVDEATFRRAVLAAYPDRVAQRRMLHGDRLLLASGTGARLGRESGVVAGEYLVAVDVSATVRKPGPGEPAVLAAPLRAAAEAVVRIATGIERDWLAPTSVGLEHELDETAGIVRAWEVDRYGALVLRRRPAPVEAEMRTRLLVEARVRQGPGDDDRALLRRLALIGVSSSFDELVRAASVTADRLQDVELTTALTHEVRRRLERDAPRELPLPSGRSARLEYQEDGRVVAAVKLQELFGLGESPRIGTNRTPVTFALLSPAGRPVQVTSDLRSFWVNGYPEVRKNLRARYPKHPWPEDPWSARPTHRVKKGSGL
jgi:ATP-dependent helicase HrpB